MIKTYDVQSKDGLGFWDYKDIPIDGVVYTLSNKGWCTWSGPRFNQESIAITGSSREEVANWAAFVSSFLRDHNVFTQQRWFVHEGAGLIFIIHQFVPELPRAIQGPLQSVREGILQENRDPWVLEEQGLILV